ncbi:hypothetical protein BpHYR1_050810 [Brachionus plicatilis]|uniref:Uncharacterized protein n=1 Tax=Brachionus plicatilis TaxID=10195 RepID=A0A3M7T7G9_BRAPC|nr:hypothetical protein BpHYR1_050810 [Brachionus plicatilis]
MNQKASKSYCLRVLIVHSFNKTAIGFTSQIKINEKNYMIILEIIFASKNVYVNNKKLSKLLNKSPRDISNAKKPCLLT